MFIVRLCTCAFSKPLRENKITKMSKGILVQQTKNPRNKMKQCLKIHMDIEFVTET